MILRLLFQFFNKLRSGTINSQPADKRADVGRCFDNLMEQIDRTLLPKNRDKYVTRPPRQRNCKLCKTQFKLVSMLFSSVYIRSEHI